LVCADLFLLGEPVKDEKLENQLKMKKPAISKPAS
jgi:hypothetical protein